MFFETLLRHVQPFLMEVLHFDSYLATNFVPSLPRQPLASMYKVQAELLPASKHWQRHGHGVAGFPNGFPT